MERGRYFADHAKAKSSGMLRLRLLFEFPAAFLRYYWRAQEKKVWNLIPPVFGFIICLLLWLNLSRPAMKIGAVWMFVGIAFGVWKTRGFTSPLSFEVPPED
jgi:hypothetical protein